VECANVECNYQSVTYKPYSVMSLELTDSLEKSIKEYFDTKSLGKGNEYKCEKCEEKTEAKVIEEILSLPNVLVFHIKRFDERGKKKHDKVKYELNLNMSEHLNEEGESEQQTYQLIGLSEHIGYTNRSGHYTAHAKRNDLWYEFNDE